MTTPVTTDAIDIYRRRRASDRARERAGRAAYLGDRAGLLIATGAAEALAASRMILELTQSSARRIDLEAT